MLYTPSSASAAGVVRRRVEREARSDPEARSPEARSVAVEDVRWNDAGDGVVKPETQKNLNKQCQKHRGEHGEWHDRGDGVELCELDGPKKTMRKQDEVAAINDSKHAGIDADLARIAEDAEKVARPARHRRCFTTTSPI